VGVDDGKLHDGQQELKALLYIGGAVAGLEVDARHCLSHRLTTLTSQCGEAGDKSRGYEAKLVADDLRQTCKAVRDVKK